MKDWEWYDDKWHPNIFKKKITIIIISKKYVPRKNWNTWLPGEDETEENIDKIKAFVLFCSEPYRKRERDQYPIEIKIKSFIELGNFIDKNYISLDKFERSKKLILSADKITVEMGITLLLEELKKYARI